MKKTLKTIISTILVIAMTMGLVISGSAVSKDKLYVGVGKADITGPITGISTGFNSMGDIMEGLVMRMNARAFAMKEKDGELMIYANAEVVHLTESIKPGVIKELHSRNKKYVDLFNDANVMISCTHSHSTSSNVSWFPLYGLVNGIPGYDDESYAVIVKGIADAIEEAYKDLAPGTITLYHGKTDLDNWNRSLNAFKWNNNYKNAAGEYAYNFDGSEFDGNDFEACRKNANKEMTILSFAHDDGGDIGMISFFASHGTSNTIDNRLISADHKGYASWAVEKAMKEKGHDDYVAAFPLPETGDISPNQPQEDDVTGAYQRPSDLYPELNLDAIENHIFYGKTQADTALAMIGAGNAKANFFVRKVELSGNLAFNYTTVDFSNIEVDEKYIEKHKMSYDIDPTLWKTSPPHVGAAIIAGTEEGAPVDNAKEGTVRHTFYVDENGQLVREKGSLKDNIDLSGLEKIADPLWPLGMMILQSDGYDDLQMEKYVCLNVEKLMQTIQPIQIFQIGEVSVIATSFEITTEQGRRIKEDLKPILGSKHLVLSTLTNSYCQYMTTREEYAAQNYEGSTTLFGPWTGAAFTQEASKLATDLIAGKMSDPGPGMPTEPPIIVVPTAASVGFPTRDLYKVGILKEDVENKVYKLGDTVSAVFTAANPRHIPTLRMTDSSYLPDNYTYMEVQKKEGKNWVTVRTDSDPYTYIHFPEKWCSTSKTAKVSWLLRDAEPGEYRLVYNPIAKQTFSKYQMTKVYSSSFVVE
ncbi:MAG: neutral/alkaline ceramidase [Ruminococcaceae bacterium]|nr:neutral/alkaline ceramidase [Oscillospiraceae bacterium]